MTHYLHNIGNGVTEYFKEPAIKYLAKHNIDKQEKLNFKWDIPFPTPQNRSLTSREAARLQTIPDDFFFEGISEKQSRTAA